MKTNILHLYIPNSTMLLLNDYFIPWYSNFLQRISLYQFKTTCNTIVLFWWYILLQKNKHKKKTQELNMYKLMVLQSEQNTFVVQFFLELKVTVFGPMGLGDSSDRHVLHSYCSYLQPRPEWQKRCLEFLTADCQFPLHNKEVLQKSPWGEQYDAIGTLTQNL